MKYVTEEDFWGGKMPLVYTETTKTKIKLFTLNMVQIPSLYQVALQTQKFLPRIRIYFIVG